MEENLNDVAGKQVAMEEKLVEMHTLLVMKTSSSINGTLVMLEDETTTLGILEDMEEKLDDVAGKQIAMKEKLDEMHTLLVENVTTTIGRLEDKHEALKVKIDDVAGKQVAMEEKLDDVAGKQVVMDEKLIEMHTLLEQIARHVVPYTDCTDALLKGVTKSGVYEISPDGGSPFLVFCDQEYNGGGWTVFQRREKDGIDFYRVWSEYKNGFGDLERDHWLGNDYVNRLTKNRNQGLTVRLQYPGGPIKYARYTSFAIESEANKYQLKISGFDGDTPPGDSMSGSNNNNNMYFSTNDRDNDGWDGHCAQFEHGAWWYNSYDCGHSNLNGGWDQSGWKTVHWYTWDHLTKLLTTTMMLR